MGINKEIENCFDGKTFFNEPMSKHTTFGTGGVSKYYCIPNNLLAIKNITEFLVNNKIRYKYIGNGSNILVSDNGFDGCCIDCSKINTINIENNIVTCFSGVKLASLSKMLCESSLTGFESLSNIPATVGGAITMNASAFGHSISDNLDCVYVLHNGKLICYPKKDCKFSYRKSRFLHNKNFIISAKFNLSFLDTKKIKKDMLYYKNLRNLIQPSGRSAGSIFKNTEKYSAGKLIELCGLKGYRNHSAYISNLHANFIIADENASSKDIFFLILYIKKKVFENFSILLNEEIEYLGEF